MAETAGNPLGALSMIDEISKWLDKNSASEYISQPLAQDWARIMKVAEELGEAIQAFIGATGQNPRKGITNDLDDFLEEMADTVITGMCCIQHFTNNANQTNEILYDKTKVIYERMLQWQIDNIEDDL